MSSAKRYRMKKQYGGSIFGSIGNFLKSAYDKAKEIKPLTRVSDALDWAGVRQKVGAIPIVGKYADQALTLGK